MTDLHGDEFHWFCCMDGIDREVLLFRVRCNDGVTVFAHTCEAHELQIGTLLFGLEPR